MKGDKLASAGSGAVRAIVGFGLHWTETKDSESSCLLEKDDRLTPHAFLLECAVLTSEVQ